MTKKIAAFLFIVLFLTSCSVWRNFNSYFNTYFNAQKFFGEVEEHIQKNTADRFDFRADNGAKTAAANINKVIEKCSAVLQDHRESAYFDNSLLMIGKAFYYQKEYLKAKRKFNELSVIEDSDLLLENKFWLGKTELYLRNFDEGLKILSEVRDSAAVLEETDIIVDAYITEIAFFIDRENYFRAIEVCNQLISESDDEVLLAELYFQLGKLYILIEEQESASEAFAKVPEFEPTFEIEFNSRFENARLLRQLGKLDESIVVLDELLDEDKNEDKFDVLELEKGLIWYEQEKLEDAYNKFYDVDTMYKRSAAAGRAKYMLGEIWEINYRDYDSAKYFYDGAITTQLEPEFKQQAQRKKQLFDKYFRLTADIFRNGVQFGYAKDPSLYTKDSLAYEEYLNRDSTEFELNRDDPDAEPELPPTKPSKPRLEADSLNNILAKKKFDMGNLFLTELNVADSAMMYYTDVRDNHGAKYFEPRLIYSIGTYYLTIGDQEKADSLFNYVYNNYYYDEVANEAAKKLGLEERALQKNDAEIKYQEAEIVMDSGDYEGAITQLDSIVSYYPESPLASRALYTKGYILETKLSMPDSAFSVYDTLSAKYRNSVYAKSVKPKYDFFKAELKRVADSIAAAEKAVADSIAVAIAEKALSDSLANIDTTAVIIDSSAVVNDSTLVPEQNELKEDSVKDSTSVQKEK